MASYRERNHTCAVCGQKHLYRFPAFANTDAWPDPHLDLRTPMSDRDTMQRFVQECPFCGYTARDVNLPTRVTQAYLDSEEYRGCGGMRFEEPLAARFYRQHLILLRDEKFSEAFFALLHAAWLCDDDGEAANAAACRRAAAELMERILLSEGRTDLYELIYADVLRRSGQFQKLLDRFSDFRPETEDFRMLIAFEHVLAEKQDDGRYTVRDALRFHADSKNSLEEHGWERTGFSLTRASRFLSLVLRHKPEVIGITLDEHGWADVDALLRGMPDRYALTRERLEKIVRTDIKNRYAFNEDHSRIRANQGHSVPVDVEPEETPPPERLFHGTAERYLESIRKRGLLPGSRLYVHLSDDAETARMVGARHGKPTVLVVHSGQMHRDGHRFYRSANGVWLTKKVPPEYLEER